MRRILSDAFKQLQLFRHYYNKNLPDERELRKTNTPCCNTRLYPYEKLQTILWLTSNGKNG